jgi:hypothetical protein
LPPALANSARALLINSRSILYMVHHARQGDARFSLKHLDILPGKVSLYGQ